MLTQAVQVLQLFTKARRELGVAEVAKILDRPKSTVSGWMSAMHKVGFLDRADGTGSYRLGIRLAALGELARRSTSLQRVAIPLVEQLARRVRETVSINILVGAEVVNAEVVESPQPIQAAGGIGIPMPIHATAAGKVLVAWKSPEEVRLLLPLRLHQFTANTVPDTETFFEELERVRRQGYAIAAGEMARDLFALSAPVHDSQGAVVGAISITAPTSRVSAETVPSLVRDLVETADSVSLGMGYHREPAEIAAA